MRQVLTLLPVLLIGCVTTEPAAYSYVQIVDDEQLLLDGEDVSESALLSTIQSERTVGEKIFMCTVSASASLQAAKLLSSIAELGDYEIIFGAGEECDSSWPKKVLKDPSGLVGLTMEEDDEQ